MIPRTLFLTTRQNAVTWYRVALPASYLGADWAAVDGEPPAALRPVTGNVGAPLTFEALAGYDAIVLQQPEGPAWLRLVRALRERGVVVLYETDDDMHSVRKRRDHDFAGLYGKDRVRQLELVMRACDGVLASTEFLARRSRALNPTVWVCRNGLDLRRYALTRPEHEGVVIGWAGATGHTEAFRPWLHALAEVMAARPEVRFVSIGQPFAAPLAERFGEERALSIPFTYLESYPAAMCQFDVALAPAGRSNFFRAKSDLRWLEASALGIAVIADPVVYPEIEPGVTGLHAATGPEAREAMLALVDDAAQRERIGAAARAYVRAHRDMAVMARDWERALVEATAGSVARAA
jgi:glycosyltransferase involved in cell wall biosynthesis